MNSMHGVNIGPRRRGTTRSAVSAPRMVQTSIYLPPPIRERLEREVLVRNMRDGATAWSLSAIVSDVLAQHFGLSDLGLNGSDQ